MWYVCANSCSFLKISCFGENVISVPKIGRKPSRLAALLRAQGAFVQEVTVGEIAGIHALYGAAELADVDMFLFTSQNGVDCFMDNVFASKLDARALGNAKIAAIGSKTAER